MPERVPGDRLVSFYHRLVESSLGLMCVHDMDGNLLFVNAAAASALGFRPEDGTRRNLRRYLAPAVQEQFDAYLDRIVGVSDARRGTTEVNRPDRPTDSFRLAAPPAGPKDPTPPGGYDERPQLFPNTWMG